MLTLKISEDGKTWNQIELGERCTLTSGANQFILEAGVKRGNNGTIFRAGWRANGAYKKSVAVKFLGRLDKIRRDRFANELRVMREVRQKNISYHYADGVLQVGDRKLPWIAMDLGCDNLRAEVMDNGAVNKDKIVSVASQMFEALKALHSKGFIHRDLKPANYVWSDDSKTSIKMIDFGLAKKTGEDVRDRPFDNITRDGDFVGPQNWASPELLAYAGDKDHSVDERSDLFQAGKVLWYLATGVHSAGLPSKTLDPFGGPLFLLVCDLLQDDPKDRPATADEVLKQLRKLA